MGEKREALKAAFPNSLPVMSGYVFLSLTYGIYMHAIGFSFIYPMLMALIVYTGSVEFLLGNLLLGSFNPMQTFLMALMVSVRHLFYGLSMLTRYKDLGWKKFFLIFGLSDETFAVANFREPPAHVDRGWYYLWITWLDETSWVIGATAGGLLAPLIHFDLKGLDFVLTAMFVAIFTDNWIREKDHTSSISGLIIPIGCLLCFGNHNFMIPSIALILLVVMLFRKRLEEGEKR